MYNVYKLLRVDMYINIPTFEYICLLCVCLVHSWKKVSFPVPIFNASNLFTPLIRDVYRTYMLTKCALTCSLF
jgi:hypothetical protein